MENLTTRLTRVEKPKRTECDNFSLRLSSEHTAILRYLAETSGLTRGRIAKNLLSEALDTFNLGDVDVK